jgi:hypothetical protein
MLISEKLGFLSSVGYFQKICTYIKLLQPSSIYLTSEKLGKIAFTDKKKYELYYSADDANYPNFIVTIMADGETIFNKSIHQHDTITVEMKDILKKMDVIANISQLVDH